MMVPTPFGWTRTYKPVDPESAYEEHAAVQPPAAEPVLAPEKPGFLCSIFGGGRRR